jgi:hypothetical protein
MYKKFGSLLRPIGDHESQLDIVIGLDYRVQARAIYDGDDDNND